MKKAIIRIITYTLAAVIFAGTCPCCFAESADFIGTDAEYVEGELVFEADSSFKGFGNLSRSGVKNIRKIKTFGDSSEPAVFIAETDGDVFEVCKALENLSGINYAEPNYICSTDSFQMPAEVPDSETYRQYQKWYLEDFLGIPEAWETYGTAGEGVLIAVIDNGFYLDAEDFPENIWENVGWNTYDNNADISPVCDENGNYAEDASHGSNIAGIIGMSANGRGGIGAAYGAELMLIKAAGYDSKTKSTVITQAALASGIYYAMNNNADIINISIGISEPTELLRDAVDAAYDSGCAIIASAGNSGTLAKRTVNYPADAENVIGVMAVSKSDPSQLASGSNYDSSKCQYYDIAAPGTEILGCEIPGCKSPYLSGTSQAAALTTACAALYLSVYPDATNDELYDAIRVSSTRTVKSNSDVTISSYTYKALNAVDLLGYRPYVKAKEGSGAVIREINGRKYLFGLNPFMTSDEIINSRLEINDMTVSANSDTAGTGTLISASSIGSTADELTVVIFGDVNGDGTYDSQDSEIVRSIAKGKLSKEQLGEAFYLAADCNHDGVVNRADAKLLDKADKILKDTDTDKSFEELLNVPEFAEYLELIEQNRIAEEQTEKSFFEKIINFFINLFQSIKQFFHKIFTK